MSHKAKYLDSLQEIFALAPDKHEANRKSSSVLEDMSGDDVFFSEILDDHLRKPGSLNKLHYPVVGIDIAQNEYFTLVANCWIPLPNHATDISTKAIHHHGDMLLSTATAFGTGYEHWTFETPCVVDSFAETYELKLIERSAHPLNHVAFVDSYIAHLPMYPPDLTITYALWSSRFPTTWKDRAKRIPILNRNSSRLREMAKKLGLASTLELKAVEYFDFYPCADGFRGIKTREEFPLTNNEDYLSCLFQIIQETGNEQTASTIRQELDGRGPITNRNTVLQYLSDLESGRQITGRLSEEHYNVERANFSSNDILSSLKAQNLPSGIAID
ncbi:MAG: hypothetical protein KF756_05095 [Acidobacteria bacterium]|nr:hypothetical protein [Acidobacteriota bacterium]